jgi:hypothetical protein
MADLYQYDVFISYDSEDRDWAADLEARLVKRRVTCFLDQRRLSKGKLWEPQLLQSIQASRHFAVLVSDRSRVSDWVNQELARFKGEIDPKGTGVGVPGRLLNVINLQGSNPTLSPYQAYDDPDIQRAYAGSLTKPKVFPLDSQAETAWGTLITQLAASLDPGNATQVPCAVLALTDKLAAKSPPELSDYDVPDLDTFLEELGVGPLLQWQARYGATPFDWRPSGKQTVREVLTELLMKEDIGINAKLKTLGKTSVKWQELDVVTPVLQEVERLAASIQTGPSLLVIDPISLFSYPIYRRYVALKGWFLNPQAAIVMLNPFGVHPPLDYLQQFLTSQSKPNLESFYDPISYNPTPAVCGINIADTLEIRRLILTSLGRQGTTQIPPETKAIIGT